MVHAHYPLVSMYSAALYLHGWTGPGCEAFSRSPQNKAQIRYKSYKSYKSYKVTSIWAPGIQSESNAYQKRTYYVVILSVKKKEKKRPRLMYFRSIGALPASLAVLFTTIRPFMVVLVCDDELLPSDNCHFPPRLVIRSLCPSRHRALPLGMNFTTRIRFLPTRFSDWSYPCTVCYTR